jgi:hypothetical protein
MEERNSRSDHSRTGSDSNINISDWSYWTGPILDDIGAVLRFIGIILLILGFRAQYKVWRPDSKELSPAIESNVQTS